MDKMCKKSEFEDVNKSVNTVEETDNEKCGSPVFKCVTQTKPVRETFSDSSDYDLPSYQINQSIKSRTSSKCGNETNDSVLPFSPIFSPIPVAPAPQFQPPSVHSLGTVGKNLGKSAQIKGSCSSVGNKKGVVKPGGIFESLGMIDKDISWVSSMASPPPKQVPGSEFNTVEKATFLPEENFQSIQPRALFSPTFDDDFGCHPIEFTSESDDDEVYKSNIRLSDVCATLKQLEVKSLDQGSNISVEKIIQEGHAISPVIKTKKNPPESVKKKKKGALVISPQNEDKYEFSVGENLKVIESDKVKSSDGSNLIEDDSFQSMSFSCIDELCKTLVTEQSDSLMTSKSSEGDKTLVNSANNFKCGKLLKKFYSTNATSDVHAVSSFDNLHSYAKALEEGAKCIPAGGKIDQSYADKGIVRFDILSKDVAKSDGTKRLHSEVTDEKGESIEKKFKKVDDSDWQNVKEFLTESQLNVSDGEIFKTVENLEKTLASQENKEVEKVNEKSEQDEKPLLLQTPISAENSRKNQEQEDNTLSKHNIGVSETCKIETGKALLEMNFPAFTTASGSKISVSEKALSKAREILKDCEENVDDLVQTKTSETLQVVPAVDGNFVGFLTSSGKEIKITDEALAKAQAFMSRCEAFESEVEGFDASQEKFWEDLKKGFPSVSNKPNQEIEQEKQQPPSSEVTEKQLGEVTEVLRTDSDRDIQVSEQSSNEWMKGFKTGTGKLIKVSAQSLEKAKVLMSEFDEGSVAEFRNDDTEGVPDKNQKVDYTAEGNLEVHAPIFKGFSTGSGKTIQISAKALEKAKIFMKECEHEFNENCTSKEINEATADTCEEKDFAIPLTGFSTALGKKVQVSSKALEKAKTLWSKSEESVLETAENSPQKLKGLKTAIEATTRGEVPEILELKKKPEAAKGEEKTDKLATAGVEEPDDWDEIIPSWLHVYSTSPSIASDRLELSPVVSHEDGESFRTDRGYVIKSPVLGSNDRFYGKAKMRKGDEKKNKSQTDRKKSAKRISNLSLDFSAPFKRIKVVEDSKTVNSDVEEERARAREEQEKIVREKQKVKPLEGSHLRKKRSERQITWMEAVDGSSPELHSDDVLRSFGIRERVLLVDIQNSMSFKFNEEYFGSASCPKNTKGISAGDDCFLIFDKENKLGVEEFKRGFLASPGVQPNLLPPGWVENHYKWIIWKLAHYERSFPLYFGGKCLTPNEVLLQLKYRYDREIDRNERSALKKILERDDSSIRRLVLCVCGIKKVSAGDTSGYEIELTDGWYSCPARSDHAMSRLIEAGKLWVGMKLLIQGAVLVNCEQGMSPLEINEGVYLRISTNSTRRVRWDTKLGFQKNPENFPISLNSILAQGGPISRIDVIIVRIYPMLYMEKTKDDHHVTRNRRSEEKADAEFRRIQEQRMEIICSEVQSEMRQSGNYEKKSRNSLEQVDELCHLMEADELPSQELDQRKLLEKLHSNENDRFSLELARKVEKRLEKEKLNKRTVSQFFRVKIVDFRKPDYNNPALLSVWNPNEDLTSLLIEGKVVSVMNVTISNSSRIYKPLQINTTRQTQFRQIVKNVKYPSRKLTQIKDVSSKVCPAFEEVDLVGMVALIQDVSYGSRLSQVVYLTDLEMNFVGVVFWGSCKDFGWENVLRIQSVVACSNLQWKKNYTLQDVPSVYVNENSVFTENPKQVHLKEEIERLKQNFPQDTTAFLSKCEEDLTAKLEDSKWHTNTSKNSSNDSSIREKPPVSGFESKPTASSTPIKPFIFKSGCDDAEPSPIQKRIEKLQSYGEPSSLIPLLIRNNMKRKFKKRGKQLSNQSSS